MDTAASPIRYRLEASAAGKYHRMDRVVGGQKRAITSDYNHLGSKSIVGTCLMATKSEIAVTCGAVPVNRSGESRLEREAHDMSTFLSIENTQLEKCCAGIIDAARR